MFESDVILYLLCGAILSAAAFTMCGTFLIGVLQQEGYSERALFQWFYKKNNIHRRRVSLLCTVLLLSCAFLALCFSFAGHTVACAVSAVAFFFFCGLFCYASQRALKVPLRRTSRAVRLLVCFFLLSLVILFFAETGLYAAGEAINHDLARVFRFVPITLYPLLYVPVLALSSLLMKVYEIPHNKRFIAGAKKKLEQSGCVKVGITGSYGKTSVKNFAAVILSEKYKVIATPASFNTPIGIAKTVNGGLDCEIFLAEMGARKTGDITELCEMVQPQYGVITGISEQHLKTFGSIAAIASEKGVLARYAKNMVLGENANVSCENAFVEGRDFAAEDIVCSPDQTTFTLRLNGETFRVETPVLGRHAAEDIALASALCFQLGMTIEEIERGIQKITPVEHRLQKIEANGVRIYDDAYNSNVSGARNALEVLRLCNGAKYVVTPGIVELGEIEEEENEKLGASLAGLDGVILVGETLVLPVRTGYLSAGGDEANLHVFATLKKAQEFLSGELKEGDSVLFLNDLPDIY